MSSLHVLLSAGDALLMGFYDKVVLAGVPGYEQVSHVRNRLIITMVSHESSQLWAYSQTDAMGTCTFASVL
jgi:hypothetical protein